MKFLCLAYGDEAGWNSLTDEQKQEVLAQDAAIRDRGNFMSAVRPTVTTVKNWGEKLEVSGSGFTALRLPLAGFSVIEADSLEEVVEHVKNTPCARANGAIEIRPFWEFN